MSLDKGMAECKAYAQERVRQERRIGSTHEADPVGFPADSPRDLEYRETEICLLGKGFTKEKL